jgi:hypothetical protein
VKGQLEKLRDELEFDGNLMQEWQRKDEEKPEDLAEVAALMSDVASSLQLAVTTFIEGWDFTEDCRRSTLKKAKEAAAAGGAS